MKVYFILFAVIFSFYSSYSQQLHEVTVSINIVPCSTEGNSPNNGKDFFVYPNPVHELLIIESIYDQIDVILVDSAGRILKKEKLYKDDFTINISGLANGVYYLTVSNEDKVKQSKVIID